MKLNNLQILRGISAILVCCFHFREALNFDRNNWGSALFEKGSIGVPIFFVISGYIMVFSTRKISHLHIWTNIVSFYKKRIIRIVPLYYLLTILWMLFSGSLLYFLEYNKSERLVKSLLFLPQKDQFPVLFLGWSLNCEMFFYFIFALSLVFKKHRYLAVILFFTISMIAGWIFTPENAFLKMITGILNIYFIIGILLGLFLDKIRLNKNILLPTSIVFMTIFASYFFSIVPVSGELFTVFPVTLLVSAFLIFDVFLKVKTNSFLKMLGDISYSIYLSHPFVEIFFRRFHTESPSILILLFIIKLAVIIIISKILYEVIEKRLTIYLKRKLLPRY